MVSDSEEIACRSPTRNAGLPAKYDNICWATISPRDPPDLVFVNDTQCFPSGFIFRGHMSRCCGKMGDTWMIIGDTIFSRKKLQLI